MSEKNPAPRPASHAAHAASRSQSRSQARRSRRHTRRKAALGLSALAAILVSVGMAAQHSDLSRTVALSPASGSPTSGSASGHLASPKPPSSSKTPSSPPASPSVPSFPTRGSGEFIRATGGTKVFGQGRLMRYAVDVEGGMGQDPEKFAQQVDAVLDDTKHGWAAGGQWSFQRVDTGPVDFTVHLASPHTTDVLCGRYGLDTGGWVNCSGGNDVVINVKRWLLLTQYYHGEPDLYHALAVNHEVGHRLGHNHVTCPGSGKPAPVMMQQIKGLHGCVINGWPYDDQGRYLTGPAE